MAYTIADIRKDYKLASLSEGDVATDPIVQFEHWWHEAVNSQIEEVNAMTLATASCDGLPSARIVLLKDFNAKGFVFFTNYLSYKGTHLQENPRAALVFFWKELERQVRITGIVAKLPDAASVEYFHSRPIASQIGAAVSPQSQVIESREWLEERFTELFKTVTESPIERPTHWGGYIVKPVSIEFWQGRSSRLHDRIQYTLEQSGAWKIERLAP
jgi:pyridoxamine 5'-phosphate oxidase